LFAAALGCAVACGDDDDDAPAGTAGTGNAGGEAGSGGSGGKGGSSPTSGGEGGMVAADSQLCMDLGGPEGIDAVVRGDGETDDDDPFNAYKFEKDGRQASVLLNVATDPCIGQQFAHLLAPTATAARDLEHLAQCLSLFVQNAAGCAVAYAADSEGVECKSMKKVHTGLGITEEDYTALINDAATALIAAGVSPSSAQFQAVAGALTADDLKADIIEDTSEGYSQPGDMCEAGGAGPGTGGAGPEAGAGGGGGAP